MVPSAVFSVFVHVTSDWLGRLVDNPKPSLFVIDLRKRFEGYLDTLPWILAYFIAETICYELAYKLWGLGLQIDYVLQQVAADIAGVTMSVMTLLWLQSRYSAFEGRF